MTSETYQALQAYLARLGAAEYRSGLAAHKGKRKYRHCPSDYHRRLVELLGQDDETRFKELKALQGYACALGF